MESSMLTTEFYGNDDAFVLTPSGLAAFLSQIEELSDLDIAISEEADGITVGIGENTYSLTPSTDYSVQVDEEVIDSIEDLNEEGYDELTAEGTFSDVDEDIEGGIIKELIKTLAVGGLVRLTKNAIQNS